MDCLFIRDDGIGAFLIPFLYPFLYISTRYSARFSHNRMESITLLTTHFNWRAQYLFFCTNTYIIFWTDKYVDSKQVESNIENSRLFI
jgi:hypothetical protein